MSETIITLPWFNAFSRMPTPYFDTSLYSQFGNISSGIASANGLEGTYSSIQAIASDTSTGKMWDRPAGKSVSLFWDIDGTDTLLFSPICLNAKQDVAMASVTAVGKWTIWGITSNSSQGITTSTNPIFTTEKIATICTSTTADVSGNFPSFINRTASDYLGPFCPSGLESLFPISMDIGAFGTTATSSVDQRLTALGKSNYTSATPANYVSTMTVAVGANLQHTIVVIPGLRRYTHVCVAFQITNSGTHKCLPMILGLSQNGT